MPKRTWGKQRAHKREHAHSDYQYKRRVLCKPKAMTLDQSIKFTLGDPPLEEEFVLAPLGSSSSSSPPQPPQISQEYVQDWPISLVFSTLRLGSAICNEQDHLGLTWITRRLDWLVQ